MSETARQWDDGADYYSTSADTERLSHKELGECIWAHLEGCGGTIEEAVTEVLTVYAWRRDAIDIDAAAKEKLKEFIGYLALMGRFHEHLELMIRYFEEETSQGDGIAEEHHDGYAAAKSLVERTKGLDGLWERAQIAVHDLRRELDDALHTFRCVEETGQFREMEARAEKAEKAEKDRDAARARVSELVAALEGMIEPAEDVGSELCSLSAGCGAYLGRLDMAIDDARAALAKAKGGAT
jgi:hypothetical protein